MRRAVSPCLALFATIILISCGGGGSEGGSTTVGESQNVGATPTVAMLDPVRLRHHAQPRESWPRHSMDWAVTINDCSIALSDIHHKKALLLLGALFYLSSLAAENQNSGLDGTWSVRYIGSTGINRAGTVTITGQTGFWEMDLKSKNDPCIGLKIPISVTNESTSKVKFGLNRSLALAECKDSSLTLVAESGETLQGTINGQSLVLQKITKPLPGGALNDSTNLLPAHSTPTTSSNPADSNISGGSKSPTIQMIYFGGNDCAPCIAWRGVELPRLREKEEFKGVEFIHVYKTVMSTVPSEAFLPDVVKPYKSKLDVASGFNRGSAQIAIIVDGEVFDLLWGQRG